MHSGLQAEWDGQASQCSMYASTMTSSCASKQGSQEGAGKQMSLTQGMTLTQC